MWAAHLKGKRNRTEKDRKCRNCLPCDPCRQLCGRVDTTPEDPHTGSRDREAPDCHSLEKKDILHWKRLTGGWVANINLKADPT